MDGCIRSGLECNVECINHGKKVVKKEFDFITKEIFYGHVSQYLDNCENMSLQLAKVESLDLSL